MAITLDFTGQAVLVTGGSNGIGHAIARAFADAGADVTITGTRASAGDYDTDLSGLTYCQLLVENRAMIDRFVVDHGAVDVLVNNAGTAVRAPGRPDAGGVRAKHGHQPELGLPALPGISRAVGGAAGVGRQHRLDDELHRLAPGAGIRRVEGGHPAADQDGWPSFMRRTVSA